MAFVIRDYMGSIQIQYSLSMTVLRVYQVRMRRGNKHIRIPVVRGVKAGGSSSIINNVFSGREEWERRAVVEACWSWSLVSQIDSARHSQRLEN